MTSVSELAAGVSDVIDAAGSAGSWVSTASPATTRCPWTW